MFFTIDHVELIARDLQESIDFYGALGFEPIRETEHHGRSVDLRVPGREFIIEMHQAQGQEVIGINHVAYRVRDLDEATDACSKHGAPLKRRAFWVEETSRWLASLRDPDGWRLQLVGDNSEVIEHQTTTPSTPFTTTIAHVEIHTRSLDRFAKLLSGIGLEPTTRPAGVDFLLPGPPPVGVQLRDVPTGGIIGLHHVAFLVSDLDAAISSVLSKGGVEDSRLEDNGTHGAYIRDPDGWLVLLKQASS